MAYEEANKHCSKQGKELMSVRFNQSQQRVSGIPTSNYDLEFRCLSKGDPDLFRPTPTNLGVSKKLYESNPTEEGILKTKKLTHDTKDILQELEKILIRNKDAPETTRRD